MDLNFVLRFDLWGNPVVPLPQFQLGIWAKEVDGVELDIACC